MSVWFVSDRMLAVALALATLPALAGASLAADDAGGRFSMTPSDDGFVRLDRQTGAVSMCQKQNGEWACKALPDDQKALQDQIGKLEQENRALKDENRRLEDVMGLNPETAKPGPNSARPDGTAPGMRPMPLPSEKDVDKAFDYVEGMLKKFQDRLKKLDESIAPPAPGAPGGPAAPDVPGAPGDPTKPEKPGRTTPL
jgi:hypothetical protein